MLDTETNPQVENRAVRKLVLYILGVVLVSAAMLAVNTGMIFALSQGVTTLLPEWTGIRQPIQMLIFLGPVLLLYLEWYLWDVITSRRAPSRGN